MKRRSAKKKVSKGVVGVVVGVGAALLAGAAALFLSKEENRKMVKKAAEGAMKKGKTEVTKAKRTVVKVKKSLKK